MAEPEGGNGPHSQSAAGHVARQGPRLRDRVRKVMRTGRYSRQTEKTYWYWIRYFIRYHRMTHPLEMGEAGVARFLSFLATERDVAVAEQALDAL